MTEKRIAEERAGGPAATLAAFRAVETATSAPPGPKLSWLGEALVHAEDIRRPLGIAHEYPVASVTAVTDFYAGSNVLIGGKNRVAGLTLQATDTDWSHGSGPRGVRPGAGADAGHHGPEGGARRAQRTRPGDPARTLTARAAHPAPDGSCRRQSPTWTRTGGRTATSRPCVPRRPDACPSGS